MILTQHMTTKTKKGLGRGLSALIPGADMEFLSRVARGDVSAEPVEAAPDISAPETAEPISATQANNAGVQQIALDDIEANPYQPRRTFSPAELDDLAASIREHGVLQPILLRPAPHDLRGKPYQLVAGERRWRAVRAAGLTHVPAIVREVADQQALELALIENVQRHDISPLDAAVAYKRLGSEFALSQEQIATRVGKSRAAVANTMRLLDLPEDARTALEKGDLSEGHGRAILLARGEGARRALLRRILRERLSVRDTEHFARQISDHERADESATAPEKAAKISNSAANRAADWQHAESELQKQLGARLKVRPRARGGQIVIDYADSDDFERLFALLTGQNRINQNRDGNAATVKRAGAK